MTSLQQASLDLARLNPKKFLESRGLDYFSHPSNVLISAVRGLSGRLNPASTEINSILTEVRESALAARAGGRPMPQWKR